MLNSKTSMVNRELALLVIFGIEPIVIRDIIAYQPAENFFSGKWAGSAGEKEAEEGDGVEV